MGIWVGIIGSSILSGGLSAVLCLDVHCVRCSEYCRVDLGKHGVMDGGLSKWTYCKYML